MIYRRGVLVVLALLVAAFCTVHGGDINIDIMSVDRVGDTVTLVVKNNGQDVSEVRTTVRAGLSYNTSWVPESATTFFQEGLCTLSLDSGEEVTLGFELPRVPIGLLDVFVNRLETAYWLWYEDSDPEWDYIGLDLSFGLSHSFGFGLNEHAFAFLPLWPGVRCWNDDGPFCSGFINTPAGPWEPTGKTIQEIADSTVDTTVSTNLKDHGGRPYYQEVLGIDDRYMAQLTAGHIEAFCLGDESVQSNHRRGWCSETIAYWHREALIPYAVGYRNDTWNFDWQVTSGVTLKRFYQTEERLAKESLEEDEDFGGRGRWIDSAELNYADFDPGVNAPCPGAFILIAKYADDPKQGGEFVDVNASSHSQMIDEMTIYNDADGNIKCVAVTLLEANSGDPPRVRKDTEYEDLLCATPYGVACTPGCDRDKRIMGFGIDLDADGNPIFDATKLIEKTEQPGDCPSCVPSASDETKREEMGDDDDVDRLVAFAKAVIRDGVRVSSHTSWGGDPDIEELSGIPNGFDTHWDLPRTTSETTITIDLRSVHPDKVETIMLQWSDEGFPLDMEVQWSSDDTDDPADNSFCTATLPQFSVSTDVGVIEWNPLVPIPAALEKKGSKVRHIRLRFPTGIPRAITLAEMRILRTWEVLRRNEGGEEGLSGDDDQLWSQDSGDAKGVAAAGDKFGAALAVGDFNGDGADDLVVGIPGQDIGDMEDAGKIQVFYGRQGNRLSTQGDQLWSQDSGDARGNAAAEDKFGAALAVGDFNGDGADDLAVGIPGQGIGDMENVGKVQVFYGRLGKRLSTQGDQLWSQDTDGMIGDVEAGDRFGAALAVGDFDGDGVDDLAVGIPGQNQEGIRNTGNVQIVYGVEDLGLRSDGNQLWSRSALEDKGSPTAEDSFGEHLAVGNFDDDECDDLAISARGPYNTLIYTDPYKGEVIVLYGLVDVGLSIAEGCDSWSGFDACPSINTVAGQRFGGALAVGDFDDNQVDDLAIGVPGDGYSVGVGGRVAVLFGKEGTGLTTSGCQVRGQESPCIRGEREADLFGYSLAAGDFDADGFDDLAIGVPLQDIDSYSQAGEVAVLYGTDTLWEKGLRNQLWRQGSGGLNGEPNSYEQFGSVLAAGDFNGDGAKDLVVGIPQARANDLEDAGKIHVIYGSDSD